MHTFNIACLVVFFISIVFAFPFVGFLQTSQVIFYVIFILIAIVNTAFHLVSHNTRVEWVKRRFLFVLPPVLLLIAL